MEQQPKQQQQKDIEIYVEETKDNSKKLCRRIKSLEKELFEMTRQRDEA
jgi:hypothetical protein